MTENYVVETAAARAYRAIHVARRDIGIAIDMIGFVLSDDIEGLPRCAEEAGWTTAAIRYARAWKIPSLPHRARKLFIDSLTEVQIATHQHVMTIRDAMYAHHVGVGTDMAVTAVVGPDSSGKPRLWGMGIQSSRVSSPGTDAARQFLEVLKIAHPLLERLEQEAHKLALDDLSGRPSEEWIVGGPHQRNLQIDSFGDTYRREFTKREPRG